MPQNPLYDLLNHLKDFQQGFRTASENDVSELLHEGIEPRIKNQPDLLIPDVLEYLEEIALDTELPAKTAHIAPACRAAAMDALYHAFNSTRDHQITIVKSLEKVADASADSETRWYAVYILGQLIKSDPQQKFGVTAALERLSKTGSHDGSRTLARCALVGAVSDYPQILPSVIAALNSALEEKDETDRIRALTSLCDLAKNKPCSLDLLTGLETAFTKAAANPALGTCSRELAAKGINCTHISKYIADMKHLQATGDGPVQFVRFVNTAISFLRLARQDSTQLNGQKVAKDLQAIALNSGAYLADGISPKQHEARQTMSIAAVTTLGRIAISPTLQNIRTYAVRALFDIREMAKDAEVHAEATVAYITAVSGNPQKAPKA